MNPKPALASGLLAMALLGGCPNPSRSQLREQPVQPATPALKTASAPLSSAPAPKQPVTEGRLIDSGLIIETFATRFGAKDLKQIPSEVIDVGIFRYVPYFSYETSRGELNIYGDPQHPAGVEIGIYAGKTSTKQELRNLMAGLLQQAADRELVHGLSLDEDKLERAGLTFEVTPPTANDGFGGWWISIYDAAAIDRARASDAEMKTIAVEAPEPKQDTPVETKKPPRKGKETGASDRVYIQDYSREDGAYVRPPL
ncbi:hypothetical protein [Archangium lansingense]|uniref:Lipoprotein n=1 Tax=Archangium lansingense TaxID=2995310 RepID=A0ABT3ZZH5_9BACT|nr:hypothetical protein [Archangium lansinium]MCY1074139.1 hypothetical protein [Archangium lansinium]